MGFPPGWTPWGRAFSPRPAPTGFPPDWRGTPPKAPCCDQGLRGPTTWTAGSRVTASATAPAPAGRDPGRIWFAVPSSLSRKHERQGTQVLEQARKAAANRVVDSEALISTEAVRLAVPLKRLPKILRGQTYQRVRDLWRGDRSARTKTKLPKRVRMRFTRFEGPRFLRFVWCVGVRRCYLEKTLERRFRPRPLDAVGLTRPRARGVTTMVFGRCLVEMFLRFYRACRHFRDTVSPLREARCTGHARHLSRGTVPGDRGG